MIFGEIKQRFWTWGFLTCLAQRFYLNWSLTLKTKSCLQIFLGIFSQNQKFFRPKFFFRPKILSDPKWTSMKMIFWGMKQNFWTWCFLNSLAQRFYLNWSLTLKTKSCLIWFYLSYFKLHFDGVKNEIDLWMDKTDILNLKLFKLPTQRFYLNWSLTLKTKSCFFLCRICVFITFNCTVVNCRVKLCT